MGTFWDTFTTLAENQLRHARTRMVEVCQQDAVEFTKCVDDPSSGYQKLLEYQEGQPPAVRKDTVTELIRLKNELYADLSNPELNPSEEHLKQLLALWLALFFAGVPWPSMWQRVSDVSEKVGGFRSEAYGYKLYGDAYRAERLKLEWRKSIIRQYAYTEDDGIITYAVDPFALNEQRHKEFPPEGVEKRGEKIMEWLAVGYLRMQIMMYARSDRPYTILYACDTQKKFEEEANRIESEIRAMELPGRLLEHENTTVFVFNEVELKLRRSEEERSTNANLPQGPSGERLPRDATRLAFPCVVGERMGAIDYRTGVKIGNLPNRRLQSNVLKGYRDDMNRFIDWASRSSDAQSPRTGAESESPICVWSTRHRPRSS